MIACCLQHDEEITILSCYCQATDATSVIRSSITTWIVVAALNGELACKILDIHRRQLLSANHDYPPIPITLGADFAIEGVVLHSIRHHVRPGGL